MRRSLVLSVAAVLLAARALALALQGCTPKPSATTDQRDASQTASPASTSDTAAARAPATDTVHATHTGKRYRRVGCRSLSRSDIPMTRQEAERKGLTLCKARRP
jgi:hypothetical protein